jgi:hypothetical protein
MIIPSDLGQVARAVVNGKASEAITLEQTAGLPEQA